MIFPFFSKHKYNTMISRHAKPHKYCWGTCIFAFVSICILGGLAFVEFGLSWYDPALVVQEALKADHSLHPQFKGREAWHIRAYGEDEGVMFLKTHKTASSSLTSVFWRNLCIKRNMNCFLPPRETPGRSWDVSKDQDWNTIVNGASTLCGEDGSNVTPSEKAAVGFPYSAWMFHTHYHLRLYEVVKGLQRVISVVRSPSARFVSAWQWYNLENELHVSLQNFVDTQHSKIGNRLDKLLIRVTGKTPSFKYRTGLDATTEELTGLVGFHNAYPQVQGVAFAQLVTRVRSGKLILLVADRFDESLLVLGRLMGWPLEHLVYAKLKVQKAVVLDEQTTTKLAEIQPHDSALFTLANSYLDRHIDYLFTNRDDFTQQLELFRNINNDTEKKCARLKAKGEEDVMCAELHRDNSDAVNYVWEKRSNEC
jgi:hypothetical protein